MQTLARVISESPTLSDELLAEKLRLAGIEEDTAELALTLLPFVFARVLFKRASFGHLLRLSDDADIGAAGEETRRVALVGIQFFRDAYNFAVRSFEMGIFSSAEIIAIAGRSAEFHLINSLLLEKKNLADFVFTPPRFLRLCREPLQRCTDNDGAAPHRV